MFVVAFWFKAWRRRHQ